MINRELLKQAQQARDEERRKQAEELAAEERKHQQKRFAEVQLVLSRLGVETSTDDMSIVDADDDYAVLIMIGDLLTGYPLRVWYRGSAWWIKVGEIENVFNSGLSGSIGEGGLSANLARFADMLDAYDAQRATALEQLKAEFPRTEPAPDETNLSAKQHLQEAMKTLDYNELIGVDEYATIKQHLDAVAQFLEAQPAEPTPPARHPDFEEWYSRLEYGLTVRIGSIIVGLNSDHMAIMDQLKVTFEDVKDAKKELADLQNAILLVEQWNKDKEDSANDIGWNDHHEGE